MKIKELTLTEYTEIKQATLDSSKSLQQLAIETGRSLSTVARIKRSTDINNYHKISRLVVTNSKKPPIITREEYDKIKEMFFRGETPHDIRAMTNHSRSVIHRISVSTDFADYKEIAKQKRKNLKRKLFAPVPPASTTSIAPTPPMLQITIYDKLDAVKENFEQVIIEFITEEIKRKYKELVEENMRLKQQNAELIEAAKPKEKTFSEKLVDNVEQSLVDKMARLRKEHTHVEPVEEKVEDNKNG